MPLIRIQLKTICSAMTSFLLVITLSTSALAFDWPFSTEEFQKKLSSQDLTPRVRYFARGPSYLSGQKWNETKFLSQLQQQNYRIRESEQILMAGDAKKMPYASCNSTTNNNLQENSTCWIWKTHDQETYLVVVNDQQIIASTWLGDSPAQPYWKASLDPILVAQYKGQQPIMQNELKISDFPVSCLNAVMAIEDSEFLNHSGLSYIGLTRSLMKNISKMRYAQGGSTITQQLVKNYFLTPEKTLSRKLREFYLAIKLESEWTKDQILETYLNIIYMGQSGAFQVLGFGAASQYYFHKPIQQLNISECALLAAIINNSVTNNPWKNPVKSASRRLLVLTKMKELNLISEAEFNDAQSLPLPKEVKSNATETAPYFFDAVRKQINSLKMSENSQNIYTSLDLEAQQNAQSALQKHISELEKSRKNLVKNKTKGLKLEGLVLSSENQTGLVNTLVGGQSYLQTQFNRALNGRRQIGSLIKPYVFLSALMYGLDGQQVTPLTRINDIKFVWKYDKKSWSPDNYEKTFNGEIPLYFALKESLNSPTAQVAQKIGLEKIIELTHQIGFTSKMENSPATSLGASVHYPIEVLDSYRTLANFGQFTPSGFIEKIKNKENETIYEFKPAFENKLDTATTSVLVGMMKETLKSGTAKSSSALGWTAPAAGKTGTTSDNKDAWFSGFTPYQTTVVWIGYDQSASSQLTGGSGALPVWVEIMKKNLSVWPDNDFKFPDTVEYQAVTLHGTNQETQLIFKK
jgi:penicillin-binding protein 1B